MLQVTAIIAASVISYTFLIDFSVTVFVALKRD
jgi:hypothetical protein